MVAVGPGQPAHVAVGARSATRLRRPVRLTASGWRVDRQDRARCGLPPIAPAEPFPTYPETPRASPSVGPGRRAPGPRRGPLPGSSPTRPPTPRPMPGRAPSSTSGSPATPPPDRVVGAMESFKAVMRDRPGATRVVIHVPAPAAGGLADGAAPRRRLRRRAAGRGPAPARRRAGGPAPAERAAAVRRRRRCGGPAGPRRTARGSRRGSR